MVEILEVVAEDMPPPPWDVMVVEEGLRERRREMDGSMGDEDMLILRVRGLSRLRRVPWCIDWSMKRKVPNRKTMNTIVPT